MLLRVDYPRQIEEQCDLIGARFSLRRRHLQFLAWFMWFRFKWRPYPVEEPPQEILEILTDNRNDKSIDAFFFDDEDKIIYLVQSKYIQDWRSARRIHFEELKVLGEVLQYFKTPNKNSQVYKKANRKCRELMAKAYDRKVEGYGMRAILVSNKLDPQGADITRLEEQFGISSMAGDYEIYCREGIIALWAEFLEGHNPPIPRYFMKIEEDGYLRIQEPTRNLEAFVTIVSTNEVSKLYSKFGDRIFEKNIRGYLGTDVLVNKEINKTLDKEPELFFFKNSGLTILTKDAQHVARRLGQDPGFNLHDVQIINGQQTTRIIVDSGKSATLLCTIIKTGQETADPRNMADLGDTITAIIAARNFQNRIGFADLKSNHPIQVQLWREFGKRGYYYQRKRGTWRHMDRYRRGLYRLACEEKWARIEKEELAAEILACIDDPMMSYKGADYIFQQEYGRVFNLSSFNTELLLAIHVLYKKYTYEICQRNEDTYPRYHILSILKKDIGLTNRNAPRFLRKLEENENDSLVRAIEILHGLSQKVVREKAREERRELSSNDVFSKMPDILVDMRTLLNSRSFSGRKMRYLRYITNSRENV